jgi:hypothetical protein
MIQPALNSLEGRMEDVESKISKIENNLGYLISDIKQFESRIEGNLREFNSGLIQFESRVLDSLNNFNDKLNALSELVGNKVEVSLLLNGDSESENLNKIIII